MSYRTTEAAAHSAPLYRQSLPTREAPTTVGHTHRARLGLTANTAGLERARCSTYMNVAMTARGADQKTTRSTDCHGTSSALWELSSLTPREWRDAHRQAAPRLLYTRREQRPRGHNQHFGNTLLRSTHSYHKPIGTLPSTLTVPLYSVFPAFISNSLRTREPTMPSPAASLADAAEVLFFPLPLPLLPGDFPTPAVGLKVASSSSCSLPFDAQSTVLPFAELYLESRSWYRRMQVSTSSMLRSSPSPSS